MNYTDVLTACEDQITGNDHLKSNLGRSRTFLTNVGNDYLSRAASATLFQLSKIAAGNPVVIESLTKNDLIKLYEYYFREKKAGGFYEKILIAANEKCPFCGGIGRPANLDHYMPKSGYPQFSVLPANLVPSCRDCNMGNKGNNFAVAVHKQILHPFLDANHFFKEQWVFARYNYAQGGQPSFIDYYVSPPQDWSQQDKDRVEQHFQDFEIGKRYSIRAASELEGIESQIYELKKAAPLIDFKTIILKPLVNSEPFVNHWRRVMCMAIINDIP